MQYRARYPEQVALSVGVESHDVECLDQVGVRVGIPHPVAPVVRSRSAGYAIILGRIVLVQQEPSEVVVCHAGEHLVEDVVVPFALGLAYETDLLEEVGLDARSHERPAFVESYLDEFAETARVVVPYRAGVPERFEYWIRLQYLLLDADDVRPR